MQQINKQYVIIGNMGVGKTTLCKSLEEYVGMQCLEEQYLENTYLPLFYDCIQRYENDKNNKDTQIELNYLSYLVQLWFINNNVKISQANKGKSIIFDRFIYETSMFAKSMVRQGYLQINDYEKLYQNVSKNTKMYFTDDENVKFIFLYSHNHELIHGRIMQRGRDMESDLKMEYVQQLNDIYNETFLGKFQKEYDISSDRFLQLDITGKTKKNILDHALNFINGQ